MNEPSAHELAGSPPKLLTIREVANILRVHTRTVYRMVQDGAIGAIRVGTQWRVPESALHEYIATGWKQWRPDPAKERAAERARQHKLPLDEPISSHRKEPT
jgi:DNA binding domain, excisionase family